MALLAQRSLGKKEAPGGILKLAKEAQEHKKNDDSVINATIGMLYDEQNKLYCFKCVDKLTRRFEDNKVYPYTTTEGVETFLDGVLDWIFSFDAKSVLDNMSVKILSTPGGSGAVSNSLSNHIDDGDYVLVSDYKWSAYTQFVNEAGGKTLEYSLFNENNEFNINDLKEKALKIKEIQKRVFIVINDPCHNPTGYCMSYEEWQNVIDLLNELSSDKTPCILLHDLAYIDYDLRGLSYSRKNISLYNKLNEFVLAIVCFSGSKTLGLYGFRIGAQIFVGKNEEEVNDAYEASCYSSRAKWSMCSTLGMNIIGSIFTNKELLNEFESELAFVRNLMNERSKAFFENMEKCRLETLAYKSGFFISITCKDAVKVCNKLKEDKVYVVPMGDYIRIALCAISIEESKRLPYLLKKVL